MKTLFIIFFLFLNSPFAKAKEPTSVALEGFDRYLPGISIVVSDEAQSLVPLIFKAFENLEPVRQPIDGSKSATFLKRISIEIGKELKLTKIYEEKYKNVVASSGFGISGIIDYKLSLPNDVTVYDMEVFIQLHFKQKLVRTVTYKWYLNEWKCRMERSKATEKSLYEEIKYFLFDYNCWE